MGCEADRGSDLSGISEAPFCRETSHGTGLQWCTARTIEPNFAKPAPTARAAFPEMTTCVIRALEMAIKFRILPTVPFLLGACGARSSRFAIGWRSRTKREPLLVVLGLMLGIPAVASAQNLMTLDEPGYLSQLLVNRPVLMSMHSGSVQDPAYLALVIRPQFRDQILFHKPDTYQTIMTRQYSMEERASDVAWVKALQQAQLQFQSDASVYPAGYPIQAFVGYKVGPNVPIHDQGGLDYKVFFEFADFQKTLSPSAYAGFARYLSQLGFQGDSKIPLQPGQARFQYNNLIVHAPSIPLAQCAEAAGIAYFGRQAIAHIARGVDVGLAPGGKPTDWHHFLLTGGFGGLPGSVQDYVRYRTPNPPSVCPNQ